MRKIVAAYTAAFVLLAGCSGGGSALAPRPVDNASAPLESAHVTIILGGKSGTPSAAVRRPKFVSPSTNGIDIQVVAHGGNTSIGHSDTDISSGSAACGGQTGLPRTCTIAVPAPPGNDDFVATTYDGKPVSGSFSAAHPLGSGKTTQNITPGAANSFTLFISGIINQLGFLPPNASLPADGATHTLGFVLNPADFDANPITAGANDPYQNPISVQLTESGASGHVQIVKNGTPSGASTTLNLSTDTVAVQYDGGGNPGYSVAIVVGSSGVTPLTLTLSPLYVTTTYPLFSSHKLTFNASGQTAQVFLFEDSAAPTLTYTATPNSTCSGIATATVPSGSPTASSTTVTAGPGAGSCTIAFSDGSSTITWNILVSTTGGSVTVPGYAVGPIDFSTGYSNGSLNGQHGWQANACSTPTDFYDANVVDTSGAPYSSASWSPRATPSKALQISNAVLQGCFSGLGSPVTPHAAGYPNALADESGATPTICGADCQPFFSMQFVVTSATGGVQPQLEMSVSPVFDNQGARMSYIGLWHGRDATNTSDKLIVFAYDVEGTIPPGSTSCFQCANFTVHEIAEVDPTISHKIGVSMQFVQPNADVVTYYVDGVQASLDTSSTFRSWEDYYLFDTESDPGFAHPVSRAVNDLLFRPGDVNGCVNYADLASTSMSSCSTGANPAHASFAGKGFLITDVTTCAATASVCAPAIQTMSFRRSTQSFTPANGTAVRLRSPKLLR